MIEASKIGENNSKCELYTLILVVLGWYAVSTVLRAEVTVPQLQVACQDWCLRHKGECRCNVCTCSCYCILYQGYHVSTITLLEYI